MEEVYLLTNKAYGRLLLVCEKSVTFYVTHCVVKIQRPIILLTVSFNKVNVNE